MIRGDSIEALRTRTFSLWTAKTGKVIWDVPAGSPEMGEYFTLAPIIWQGRTFHRHFWKRCRCNRKNDGAGSKERKALMEL